MPIHVTMLHLKKRLKKHKVKLQTKTYSDDRCQKIKKIDVKSDGWGSVPYYVVIILLILINIVIYYIFSTENIPQMTIDFISHLNIHLLFSFLVEYIPYFPIF